jgi:DNA-binding transcriptional ArsR family regulator
LADDASSRDRDKKKLTPDALSGTTLKVYRYLYRAGKPVGVRDLQRGLGLSSPSVAQYHIKKLLDSGLLREEAEGYVVDKNLFENTIRVRRSLIPLQISYAIFYATLLAALFIFFASSFARDSSLFIFAFVSTVSGLILFAFQAFKNRNFST